LRWLFKLDIGGVRTISVLDFFERLKTIITIVLNRSIKTWPSHIFNIRARAVMSCKIWNKDFFVFIDDSLPNLFHLLFTDPHPADIPVISQIFANSIGDLLGLGSRRKEQRAPLI